MKLKLKDILNAESVIQKIHSANVQGDLLFEMMDDFDLIASELETFRKTYKARRKYFKISHPIENDNGMFVTAKALLKSNEVMFVAEIEKLQDKDLEIDLKRLPVSRAFLKEIKVLMSPIDCKNLGPLFDDENKKKEEIKEDNKNDKKEINENKKIIKKWITFNIYKEIEFFKNKEKNNMSTIIVKDQSKKDKGQLPLS